MIHTDAIKNYILPNIDYYKDKSWLKYAEEVFLLNVIIFKSTAKQWKKLNPTLVDKNNMRDFATINELTVLSNLESHNAELIKQVKTKEERFDILTNIANYQLGILNKSDELKQITNWYSLHYIFFDI